MREPCVQTTTTISALALPHRAVVCLAQCTSRCCRGVNQADQQGFLVPAASLRIGAKGSMLPWLADIMCTQASVQHKPRSGHPRLQRLPARSVTSLL